jgi:hypothetical protein
MEVKFGPMYVKQWQERIKPLKIAEEVQEETRNNAAADTAYRSTELQHAREEDQFLEDMANDDNERVRKSLDRNVVERWLNTFAKDMEPGLVSYEDSDKLWADTTFRETEEKEERSLLSSTKESATGNIEELGDDETDAKDGPA